MIGVLKNLWSYCGFKIEYKTDNGKHSGGSR